MIRDAMKFPTKLLISLLFFRLWVSNPFAVLFQINCACCAITTVSYVVRGFAAADGADGTVEQMLAVIQQQQEEIEHLENLLERLSAQQRRPPHASGQLLIAALIIEMTSLHDFEWSKTLQQLLKWKLFLYRLFSG